MNHGYLGGLHRGHAVLRLRHDEQGVSPARSRLRPDGLHVRREYVLDVGHGSVILRTEILRHQLRHRHLSDDPRCHYRPPDPGDVPSGLGQLPGRFLGLRRHRRCLAGRVALHQATEDLRSAR